jgi:HEAT repeat protein
MATTCLVCLVLLTTGFAQGQGPAEMSLELRKAGLRPGPLLPVDVTVLHRALGDPDGETRMLAREVVAMRLQPWRALKVELRGPYLADLKALQPLRSALLSGLKEGPPVHRKAAVQSIAFLSLTWVESVAPSSWLSDGMPFDVDPEIANVLMQFFEQEPDASVRREIVGLLAGTRHLTPEPNRTTIALFFTRAVADSDWGVVQAALGGLGRRKRPEGLTEGARLLKHPAHQVRMVAAQVVASYGADAKPYVPGLRAALAAETDDITRKTIQGAITVIEKGGTSCSSCSSW